MSAQFDEWSELNEELPADLADSSEAESALEIPDDLPLRDVAVVTEPIGRQRQISATIQIPHPITHIWQILTDYDHLADFIPNLAKSQRIEHPQGGIRLEQVGVESLLRLKFCARVVLDMVEHFPHQLDFNMVEGDFKLFQGCWQLNSLAPDTTELCYTVTILPPRVMPVRLIERRLSNGLIVNLSAIYQRAEVLFGKA